MRNWAIYVCGKPLLCAIPAVFLGGWIFILKYVLRYKPQWVKFEEWKIWLDWPEWTELINRVVPLLVILLVLVMVVLALGFFSPMLSIYKTLVAKREVVQQQMDQLALDINHLARELLERADELESVDKLNLFAICY